MMSIIIMGYNTEFIQIVPNSCLVMSHYLLTVCLFSAFNNENFLEFTNCSLFCCLVNICSNNANNDGKETCIC